MPDELENRVDKVEDRLDRVERLLERTAAITLSAAEQRAEVEKVWKLRPAELEEAITLFAPLSTSRLGTTHAMAVPVQYKS